MPEFQINNSVEQGNPVGKQPLNPDFLFHLFFDEELIVDGAFVLLADVIEARQLIDVVDTQPIVLLQRVEEDEAQQEGPRDVGQDAHELDADLLELARVNHAVIIVENSYSEDAPDATDEMDFGDVHGVINLCSHDQLFALAVDNAADDANDGS